MNALRLTIRRGLAPVFRRNASGAAVDAHGKHGQHHVVSSEPEQPHIPVATYDDIPIPQYPFKEMYDKENRTFNMLLAGAVTAFVATAIFFFSTDVMGIEYARAPLSYRNRKIYKPEDP